MSRTSLPPSVCLFRAEGGALLPPVRAGLYFSDPLSKFLNLYIIYLDALQNFRNLTALVVTTKFYLCFRCDLQALFNRLFVYARV
jgi:hypothetical protein